MCDINPAEGRYYTASVIFRGRLSTYDVENGIKEKLKQKYNYFIEWIPDNIKYTICDISS